MRFCCLHLLRTVIALTTGAAFTAIAVARAVGGSACIFCALYCRPIGVRLGGGKVVVCLHRLCKVRLGLLGLYVGVAVGIV